MSEIHYNQIMGELNALKKRVYLLEKNVPVALVIEDDKEPLQIEANNEVKIEAPKIEVTREALRTRIEELKLDLYDSMAMREDLSEKNTDLHIQLAEVKAELEIAMKELQRMKEKYEPED